MYYDTIHITFESNGKSTISFGYDFLISKSKSWLKVWQNYNNSPRENHIIKYNNIIDRFKSIGFNTELLSFPNIKDDTEEVYCAYNYLLSSGNFEVFFKAYEKVLKKQSFNINFEYGSMINGEFYPNNMNSHAIVQFIEPILQEDKEKEIDENIIQGKSFIKHREIYQIVNKEGESIYVEQAFDDFENTRLKFFQTHKVAVYLRKYKLLEIMYNN